jgi:hypothetical protein
MHPMLISALADQIVRERSRSRDHGLSRSLASRGEGRAPRRTRRGGFRLALRPPTPWRAS